MSECPNDLFENWGRSPPERTVPDRIDLSVHTRIKSKDPRTGRYTRNDGAVICRMVALEPAKIDEARRVYVACPSREDLLADPLGLWEKAGIPMERVAAGGIRMVMESCTALRPRANAPSVSWTLMIGMRV